MINNIGNVVFFVVWIILVFCNYEWFGNFIGIKIDFFLDEII